MATVKILYRSKKNEAELKVRLLYTVDKNYVLETGSKIVAQKEIFEKYDSKSKTRDIEVRNKIHDLNTKTNSLQNYILKEFKRLSKDEINKDWLKKAVTRFYETQRNIKSDIQEKPQGLIYWTDKYIDYKTDQVANSTLKKYNVMKNYLTRFEEHNSLSIYVNEVNVDTISNFKNFMINEDYDLSTTNRAIKFIKTICNYAKINGIDLNNNYYGIKLFKEEKKPIIFLKEIEIEEILKLKLDGQDDIVRDWFIIGYNTGQRFSDFIDFNISKITNYGDKLVLNFIQKKGNKPVAIPLNKKIIDVLEKYDWSFPKAISLQYFNERIKYICKRAKIKKIVYGEVKMKTKEGKYRGVVGHYPKYKLIGSHTCRRSFASNKFGFMPTGFIRKITGHSSESALLIYIGKSENDLAMEIAQYLE
jgi:integrase